MKKILFAIAVVALGACGGGGDDGGGNVAEVCVALVKSGLSPDLRDMDEYILEEKVSVGADESITINAVPQQPGMDVLVCMIEATAMPARVVSHLEGTRALDGMQEDTWDAWSARWSYHPDSGVDITFWME